MTNDFKIYEHILCVSDHKLLNFLVYSNARNLRLRSNLIILFNSYFCAVVLVFMMLNYPTHLHNTMDHEI